MDEDGVDDGPDVIDFPISSPRRNTDESINEIANVSSSYAPANRPTNTLDEPLDVASPSAITESAEDNQQRWDLNYHEASIYLQEGESNDKFTTHPGSQSALPAYIITHNTSFYVLDFIAALTLMLLVIVEPPHVHPFAMHIALHSSIELLCLLVIGMGLGMRLMWLGPKTFTRHVRSMIKTFTLLVMVIEAIVVLARQTSHFRITRALRPLFLVDSYYTRGVRRFIRQIIQSLPPILDMLLLLLFFMLIFSVLGFYLFTDVPNDTYFRTIEESIVSLFVLLTTANYPDVMMPAYNHSRFACLFFITYLSVELYFIMSLLLAVVYDAFSNMEKLKLKKLWWHKREACRLAFKLLVTDQHSDRISVKHFTGLMRYFHASMGQRDVYLMFKALDVKGTGYLSLEEFYDIYNLCGLTWKHKKQAAVWSSNFAFPLNVIFRGFHWLVTLRWFEYLMYVIILTNTLWIFSEAVIVSLNKSNGDEHASTNLDVKWSSIMFVSMYITECILKILGLGPSLYFASGWNIFDFTITALALLGTLLELAHENFYYIIIIRPIRLLRLFRAKKRLRDVLGTLFILLGRLVSLAIVILLLYYVFGVIGIEIFSSHEMRNCCKNSTVEMYYVYDNKTGLGGFYYLNNFDNIISSGVTLFELTVVNNWYIIMEGYASVTSRWSRLYFMTFYIVTMVVMTVVVAFILEAFLFRIQYKNKMHVQDMDDDAVLRWEVAVSPEELQMCLTKGVKLHGRYITLHSSESISQRANGRHLQVDNTLVWFRGERRRGKQDYSLKMYEDEVEEWLREESRYNSSSRESDEEELQDFSADLDSSDTACIVVNN